ncbi:hypothetical protein [Denitromonas sp.]|uniref:hypothetical protein n=1 Tax=Denitromonas sp. TaxID=2734609 RepID=UPI003A858FAF
MSSTTLADLLTGWLPSVLIVVIGVVILVQRQHHTQGAEPRLRAHGQAWLAPRFGDPIESTPTLGGFGAFGGQAPLTPGYRLLRQRATVLPPDQRGGHPEPGMSLVTMLQDAQQNYWLVLLHNHLRRNSADIEMASPPRAERITELRARRALFNDAPAYQRAFGVPPSLTELTAWRRRHPEQEPGDPQDD